MTIFRLKGILLNAIVISAVIFSFNFSVSSQSIDFTASGDGFEGKTETGSFLPRQTNYVRPDSNTRFKRYLNSMFGPEALFKAVANAGISTARDTPREWGPHWDGFGKRVASNLGTGIISSSVRHGLDETFKLDSHFYRSQKRDTKSRVKNALSSPFLTRTAEGKRVFGFPRIVGTYTGHIVAAEVWFPKRYNVGNGLKGGTISLGMSAVYNLVREFIKK